MDYSENSIFMPQQLRKKLIEKQLIERKRGARKQSDKRGGAKKKRSSESQVAEAPRGGGKSISPELTDYVTLTVEWLQKIIKL